MTATDQDHSPQTLAQLLGPSLAARLTTTTQRAEARAAFDIIATREGDATARAWLIGQNPDLEDQAPLTAILAGRRSDVLEAARAYVEVDA